MCGSLVAARCGCQSRLIATVLAIFNSRHNHSQGRPNGHLDNLSDRYKCKVSLHPVLNFFTLLKIFIIAKIFMIN